MITKIVAVQGNNPLKLNPVTDTSIFQKDFEIPPELNKLVESVSHTFSESDLNNLDPMKLLFSNNTTNSTIIDTIKDKFKDIDGICNELASTTGLAAPAALRSINA